MNCWNFLERYPDRLMHVEIAVGAEPAGETHIHLCLRPGLIPPLKRVVLNGSDRIVKLIVSVGKA